MTEDGKPTEEGKLFDTTHPAHAEVVACCQELHTHRTERLEAGREETKVQEKLLVLMHEHGLDEFDYDGIHAEIVVEKEKVRVKIKAEDGGEDDPGE